MYFFIGSLQIKVLKSRHEDDKGNLEEAGKVKMSSINKGDHSRITSLVSITEPVWKTIYMIPEKISAFHVVSSSLCPSKTKRCRIYRIMFDVHLACMVITCNNKIQVSFDFNHDDFYNCEAFQMIKLVLYETNHLCKVTSSRQIKDKYIFDNNGLYRLSVCYQWSTIFLHTR